MKNYKHALNYDLFDKNFARIQNIIKTLLVFMTCLNT